VSRPDLAEQQARVAAFRAARCAAEEAKAEMQRKRQLRDARRRRHRHFYTDMYARADAGLKGWRERLDASLGTTSPDRDPASGLFREETS